ncbi:DMT family transporter [Aquabacter spiritensis]|uniref:Drug/metabolite transporter (DMT)-like permease n=1 Tax=Aquabacter spiritensis TaxID=933073 RepID=A0A4R3LUQ8_9HYPH|nr:DMT family transporter [Aquabacter spiritensis]TCT04283.1 drug/metabolite transporter (DMT)-like permease [Aquabacter spiritensis]
MSVSPLARLGRRLYDAPYLLLTCTAFFWASNMVLGRYVAGHIPPLTLACLRWALATLLILPFAWRQLSMDAPIILRNIPALILLAATGIACYNAMSYYGLQYTQALNGLLIQSSSPLLIALWTLVLFRDRLSRGQIAGILLSLLGVTVIICRGDLDVLLHLKPNVGDLWLLLALIIYCFYAAILRIRPPLGPLSFLAVTMGIGAIQLIPFALWEAASGQAFAFTPFNGAVVLYVSIFPALVAYLCFNRGVELVGANRAAPFFHLMPVFGSALAILFLGEIFAWYHGVGYALVIAGIVTATRAKSASAKSASTKPIPAPKPDPKT